MDDIKVSQEGIEKLLRKLNPSKAAGPDALPPSVLKELAADIAPVMTVIFQCTLDSGSVPTKWLSANISPIFKKGEKYKASNYRPVSLTCIVSKLMEHIITSHLLGHLDLHDALVDAQHGFHHQHSCETQLLQFIEELARSI